MITAQQWAGFRDVKRAWFKYPDQMEFSIVSALDRFIGLLGSEPIVLSDYRPNDPKQHGRGLAADTIWPSEPDPLRVWELARASKLFTGLGVYLNDSGKVSFHFDRRTDRTPDDPALWGDFISHPFDPDLDDFVRVDDYTTADAVLAVLEKKSPALTLVVVVALWWVLSPKTETA